MTTRGSDNRWTSSRITLALNRVLDKRVGLRGARLGDGQQRLHQTTEADLGDVRGTGGGDDARSPVGQGVELTDGGAIAAVHQ